jgi:hypothetical protein
MSSNTNRHRLSPLWKIPVIAAAYLAATMISGALVTAAGLKFPEAPGQSFSPIRSVLAALVLGAAAWLLARGIRGSAGLRWLALFVFSYVAYCVNNQIEGAIFTTMGGFGTMLVFFVFPCAVLAGAAVGLVRPRDEAAALTSVFSDRGISAWWWRAVLAWLAFPVIYFFFGMIIYPFVSEFYESGQLGLVVPDQGVILSVVTFRSLLFLVVTVPILNNWSGSRRGLALSLGVALAVMVGVAGMIEVSWFPTRMRIVHGLEITADSLVHAWLLVALLMSRKQPEEQLSPVAAL